MNPTGRIHAAKVIRPNGRLDRVLQLLRLRGARGATTRDIVEEAHVCSVSAIASELRANGFEINCQSEGRDVHGVAIYRYRLIEREPVGGQGELFGRVG